ncbi:MAG: hypothetical protein LHW57_01580 [Candidatus Cloacimonetes bacterium]|nr:hypothetical protein [Candidatus Cloacimonadota bacterium]
MKPTAQELKIMQRMQPGVITLSGFLGSDTRPLNEILESDSAALAALDRSQQEIADRMESFSQASWDSYLGETLIEGKYLVQTDVYRGRLPCPYGHPGIFRKAITRLTNQSNGLCVVWTSLNIHLIREHGFFEGKGSAFRLEPKTLVKALFE